MSLEQLNIAAQPVEGMNNFITPAAGDCLPAIKSIAFIVDCHNHFPEISKECLVR